MKKLIYSLITISFIFTSCSKEQGCMDAIATNYNADAEEDDNSCIYNLVGGSWLTISTQEEGSVSATMMGVTMFDSSWTNIETDSLEPYRLKFNSDGTAQSYLSDESIEENQIIDEPKETVKIMDLPSSNTNASLIVSIDSNEDSKNDSI